MSSIKQVAQVAGVSVTTVSYVLNDKGNISPETRQKVLRVIEELNYKPSVRGRSLRAQQSHIIGYAWRAPLDLREGNPVLDSFLHEVINLLEDQNFHVLIFNDPRETKLETYRDLVNSERVDGFILANTEVDDQRVAYLHEADFPFVSFGRSASPLDAETAWVDIDGHAGIYQATEHLIQQGHEQIALLGWPQRSVAGDARQAGYIQALADYGLPFNPDYIMAGDNLVTAAYVNTRRLMSLAQPPSAIVALSDIMALGAGRYLNEGGLRVALTGFDDTPTAEYITPPLTSLRQPIEQVAALLVEMLLKQLRGEALDQAQHILKPELIIRASSLIQ